jgi:hypothetical protein
MTQARAVECKPRGRETLSSSLKFIRSRNSWCLRREIPERRGLTNGDVKCPSRGPSHILCQGKNGSGIRADFDSLSTRVIYPPDVTAFNKSTQQLLE